MRISDACVAEIYQIPGGDRNGSRNRGSGKDREQPLLYSSGTVDRPSPERQRRRRRRRLLRRILEIVLLAAALYLGIGWISEIGWEGLTSRIRGAEPGLVAAAAALLGARWAVWATRWRLGLKRRWSPAPWWHCAATILAAAVVNHLTPSFRIFGGLLRARYLGGGSRRGFTAVYGSVLFDQIVAQTVIGALAAIAFSVLAWRLDRLDQMMAGLLAVLALLLLVPLLLGRLRRRRIVPSVDAAGSGDSLAERLGALWRRVLEVLRSLEVLLRDPRLLIATVLLSLLYVACNWGAAWLAFESLGGRVDPLTVFLALSLGTTVGALSGTPGGSLTTEAAMVTCYALLGVDRELALSATLLYRGLHYLLVALLGLPSLLLCEGLHRRRSQSP